jgi:bifunctional DNA-binding transcriptional regulator/antitoxin component of YhaV-PrlF toxin-antitoxin module
LPLTEVVEFLTRLQKHGRVQIPVEIRWRYKLELGELMNVWLSPVNSLSHEKFVARLTRSGRITVPHEVAYVLKLDEPRCMLRVRLDP